MIKSFKNFFGRRDPRQEAGLTLARLLTQLDLLEMPFDNGVRQTRRSNSTRYVAIGIWLMPLGAKQNPEDANFDNALPAVTADLRRLGVGLLMPLRLPASRVLLAFADAEDHWKFFVCNVRHNSPGPGGWFKIGLAVEGTWEPEPLQISHFRNRIMNAFGNADTE
jgi:hypothetical protein